MNKLLKWKRIASEVWDYNVVSKFKTLLPKALTVIVTYKCNSKCQMCNIWQMKPVRELDYEDWKNIAGDSVFSAVETLTVTGGEGFLYPRYVDTVKMLIESLPKLQKLMLNTNGFLPDDIFKKIEKIAKICLKKNIRLRVSVSVDGLEKRHDEIRRVKNGFKSILRTIGYLNKVKEKGWLDFGVASVLMEKNLNDYWEMKKWFEDEELNYSFQLIGFHDTYVNNIDSRENLDFKKSQKNDLLEIIKDIRKDKKGMGINSYYWTDMLKFYQGGRRQTPCPFLMDELVVDSLGDVYYCLSARKIGNTRLEGRSVGEIYFDPKNIEYRKGMWRKECRRCNSSCDVTRAIAASLGKFVNYKLTGRV